MGMKWIHEEMWGILERYSNGEIYQALQDCYWSDTATRVIPTAISPDPTSVNLGRNILNLWEWNKWLSWAKIMFIAMIAHYDILTPPLPPNAWWLIEIEILVKILLRLKIIDMRSPILELTWCSLNILKNCSYYSEVMLGSTPMPYILWFIVM